MSLALVVIGLFAIVYAGLLVLAIRRPLLARLALREAVRRPGQSAIVVLGLMVGTVAIFSSQVMGDSFRESQTQEAYLAWGHVDMVAADGGRFFDPAMASKLATDPRLKSSLAGVQAGVELPSSVVDLDRGNAKPLVTLVGFDPATQRPFGSYVLTDGKTTLGQDLASDQVLVSATLASALEARTGDRLRIIVGPNQVVQFRLAGIARAEGPGAYTLRPALFTPIANLGPLLGGQGINVIRLAAPGEGQAELDRALELAPKVRAALQTIAGGTSLVLRETKSLDVNAKIKQTETDRSLFAGLSLMVALAGAALVVNLGLALAEERRPRHAVLRALGLGRAGMVTLSVLEGALYSLVAVVAALAPGAVIGLVIVRALEGGNLLYTRPLETRTGLLLYAITPGSAGLSIAIGALIVLATLFATSIRSSRMQISSAIRNLPEPASRRKRSIWRTVFLSGLGLGSLAALVPSNLSIRLVGGVGLVVVAAALVGSRISGRLRATLTGAALTVWAAATIVAVASSTRTWDPLVIGLGALVAVFGLSLIVAANLRILEIPAGMLKGGARATLRPSLAYLTRRPLRAGLGIGAFALVLALMTTSSVFVATYLAQSRSTLSEYDIRVTAPTTAGVTIPDSVRPQILMDVAMPTRPYRGEVILSTNPSVPQEDTYLPLYSLSPAQLAAGPFQLASRESRFNSDAEVWAAMAQDPHLIVTPTYGSPGMTVTLAGPDGPVQFRVAGGIKTLGLWGLAGSEAAMAPFATLPVGTTILAKTAPGANAEAVARQIQREVFSQGAEVTTVKEMFDSTARGPQAGVNAIQLIMGIGLLVGVLSLGILALRAVIERRRAIGMLRALGYRPGQVLAGIVSEGLITATCGALVGIGVGLLIGAIFMNAFLPGGTIAIDGSAMSLTIVLVYLAILAVTIPPALRAARLRAAEALRLED
jgi:putative ABC transport system permease protein